MLGLCEKKVRDLIGLDSVQIVRIWSLFSESSKDVYAHEGKRSDEAKDKSITEGVWFGRDM